MATWKEWEEYFDAMPLSVLKTWDDAMENLPPKIYKEFSYGVEALEMVRKIMQNSIKNQERELFELKTP